MASQGDDNADLGAASAGGTPVSQVEPGVMNNSVYQPIDGSHNHQREKLQALGAVRILNGATILALGVFLGCSLQSVFHPFWHFFFIFYTGYPLWGAIFFIISGSLSVAAGRKPTRMLMQNSFGVNIASMTIALVGLVFLSINLAVNEHFFKECQYSQSLELCICMDILSNGLMSLMLILTLLELCISFSVSVMWCTNSCNSREAISSPSNSA
ncbi:membrane-spanning 4-domains subfamily A member 3 [Suricata suricatta]|uniref:Membrane spanning 4-domains A3 n=1 Tax=Suricata suricatta TaxID=37032 RepID=A0A673TI71_SURSU|nr:membrane-spanning 4-domains subfamily A member 3 [Suricata suricatta]